MDDKLVGLMDDCLLNIGAGKRVPKDKLYDLPPWRAVMIASVAVRAGALTQEEYDELKKEAVQVGGTGKLANIYI